MVWQQITEDSADRYLQDGALGVADHHTDRLPRDLALRLIQDRLVRRLFLECDSTDEPKFNEAVTKLQDSPQYEAISDIVDKAGPQPYDNDVTLGEVAVFALRNRVPVHFIDLEIKSKTKPGIPAIRDAHAADLFRKITRQHGPKGCLVLYGGAHLIGGTETYRGDEPCLGQLLDLSYVLMPWFEIQRGARNTYSFRLCADKGETIATGNSYPTRAEAFAAIKAVKRAAAKARVPR